jgi:cytochrome b561
MTYGSLPPGGYPPISKLLHWLVAICVLLIVPLGLVMVYENPMQNEMFIVHKSLGMLILILMALRLINRFVTGAPAPEPGLAAWQRAASSAVHGLLYLALTVQPIIGYVGHSAFGEKGTPTPFFWLFEFPPIVSPNNALSDQLFSVHRVLGWVIAALVVVHIGAALQHYFIIKDGVLQRMLPRALGGR